MTPPMGVATYQLNINLVLIHDTGVGQCCALGDHALRTHWLHACRTAPFLIMVWMHVSPRRCTMCYPLEPESVVSPTICSVV